MKRVSAKAIVRLKIEIPLTDRWGEDCDFSQVQKQARDSAVGTIRKIVELNYKQLQIRILEEPEVTAILVEEERP